MGERVYRVKSGNGSTRPAFVPTRGSSSMLLDPNGELVLVPRISGGADEVYRVEIPVTVNDRTEPAMSNIRRKVGAFEGGLMRTERRLKSWGSSVSNAGRSLTRNLTMPLVGAAAASLKLYADFEKSMTSIRALVGASGKQMTMYRDKVLQMARAFPQGPQELAEALYFVTSSGFKGAKALDVLESSAKAAAAGLGSTVEVADAVTSAVNAYGSANLKASAATDVLLATVREGKAEPTELAGAIGRVIAPAEAMGVTFAEVGASVAALSLTGLDAAESVTALRGIFTTFLKPTKMAKDALKELGLSTEEIQVGIKRDFMGTMVKLREEFGYNAEEAAALSKKPLGDLKASLGSNYEAMGAVIGNVRALNGFLALTGRNVEKNERIFRKMNDAVGDTDAAFRKAKSDPMFKFNKAMSNLKTTAIEVAPVLLPVATKILKFLEKGAKAVASWPEDKLERIVKMLGVALVAGPAMRLLGGGLSLAGRGAGLARGAMYGGGAMMMGGGMGMGAGGGSGRSLPPGVTRGMFGLRRGTPTPLKAPGGLSGQAYGALGSTMGRAPGQTGRVRGGLGKLARGAGAAARGSVVAAMLAPFAAMGAKALGEQMYGGAAKSNEVWDRTEEAAKKLASTLLRKGAPAVQAYREQQAALIDQMGSDEEKYAATQEMLDAISRGHNKAALSIMQQTNKYGGMNKVLTKQERKWFDTATAANEFALAQKIVDKALQRTKKQQEENGKEADRTKDKYKGLSHYMQNLPKSIESRIELITMYGSLKAAAQAIMRLDQWAMTSGEWNIRGAGTGALPGGGGGGKGKGGGGGSSAPSGKPVHDYPHTMRVRGPGVASFNIGNIEEDISFSPRGAGRGAGGGRSIQVTVAQGAVQISGIDAVTPDVADRIADRLAANLEDVLSNLTEDVA